MENNDFKELVEQATTVREKAYAPYSNYKVGAALRTESGKVFTGCNVENASYPIGICAERAALVKAVSEGEQDFDTIVVVTSNGGSPCGMCRQMLYEFAPELRVVIADTEGKIHLDVSLDELLAHGFSPQKLDG